MLKEWNATAITVVEDFKAQTATAADYCYKLDNSSSDVLKYTLMTVHGLQFRPSGTGPKSSPTLPLWVKVMRIHKLRLPTSEAEINAFVNRGSTKMDQPISSFFHVSNLSIFWKLYGILDLSNESGNLMEQFLENIKDLEVTTVACDISKRSCNLLYRCKAFALTAVNLLVHWQVS